MRLSELSRDELVALRTESQTAYDALLERGLKLDLTRGKPSAAQLDLSNELLELPGAGRYTDAAGVDCRNYGGTQGLTEVREIFAPLLGVPAAQLVAGDNASLSIMHDALVFSLLKGTTDGPRWVDQPVKFLCPVPGYDRHFALCEAYGIEMVPVDLGPHGPDLDQVRALVADDPSVKGMWVVPTYANPDGAVYSEEVTRALVEMETAAPDFRIFWDNAYAVHHLTEDERPAIDVLGLAEAAGHPDRVFVFASSSKITFAGAGVSFFGSSPANVAWYLGHLAVRTIGPDKLNHLRHALYLRDAEGVRRLMRAHREILRPKFDQVAEILTRRLGEHELASWTDPEGGYFISLDVPDGTASRVVALAKQAGIAMTAAGAAFPYGRDPRDRNIRIAPSMPAPADVAAAIDGLATCVLLAAAEQRLGE
ncbi:DNA-binding transcriptional regulator, MocR family, contains an aminotransferase domain [Microlunatus sagamiharensis]|uniref:DNA-binding transcriptional regulator, MocR family, contains an aminotransferase domain n=1 Tax=Microlunatus sagamiharensis TaxID=546874 RepID=A0A1H2MYI1_9ACTN|nr:aminotransferase class I/II-fold pyridoxal phosphate-dependent enzyme [Microlunatus sagamiharensis]SDU97981.1 DNA-binding transcriptional regulator, MocR family, contains an aminotransferase domain [Microlunatus sagamiharensis]